MTSIRRRYGHDDGVQPGYGGTEPARWPRFVDMRPLLIRSAGIVGIAGAIVGVISSGALVGGPRDEVGVASAPVAEAPAPSAPVEDAAPATGHVGPELSIFASPTEAGAVVQSFSRVAVRSAPRRAAPAEPPVPAVEAEAEGDADILAEGDTDAAWTDEAVACPQDWAAAEGGDAADPASPACRALAAVIPPQNASSAAQEALSQAASEHAQELALLEPRLPKRRPDPPKRARYRSAPDGALPAPPDCGSKHAYWRYVDRKAGIREWHCK